ncbi:MAG: sensor histidine kinase [Acidimicrobiales bacterium]
MKLQPGALFEDPWADASMRRTIPLYARLGGITVIASAPLLTADTSRRIGLLILASAALATASVLTIRGLIDSLPRPAIFVVLTMYCVIIAGAVALTGRSDSPYRLFYVLPVTFTGAFFSGRVRYAMAPLAVGIDWIVLSRTMATSAEDAVTRCAVMLLLAMFVGMVADILREALRTNRALQAVLEAATGHLAASEIVDIGVDAALAVSAWDSATVLLVDGDHFRIAALRGASDEFANAYGLHPVALDAKTFVPQAHALGSIQHIEDVVATLGPDNPMTADGLVSAAAIPLRYHGEGVGVLVVGHRTRRSVEGREADRLNRVASQLGLALGSAMAWQQEEEVVARLRSLNRQKDDFLSNVSHELRTPATAIRLVTSTLRRAGDTLNPDQRRAILDTLERRTAELTALIENLLEESVAESGQLRLSLADLDWSSAVQTWAKTAADQTGRPISIVVPEYAVRGRADPVKIERILVNLLVNAAKFSEPDSEIALTLDDEGSDVLIRVDDRGVGINQEDAERIFDRFHQVDGSSTRSVGGFGIGLSLVKFYAEAHGGSVTVESEPGAGSSFLVRLPRVAINPEPNRSAGSLSDPSRRASSD